MKNRKVLVVLSVVFAILIFAGVFACGKAAPSITLNKTKITLAVGDREVIKATVTGADGAAAEFSSSDKSVATVKSNTGVVTAVAKGTAKITAKITVDGKDYSAECAVTVTEPTNVPTIELDKTELSLVAGESHKLVATTTNADGVTVGFTGTDDHIASVAADGTVTGVAAGEITVTASITVNNKDYTAECAVTVTAAPTPTVTFDETVVSIEKGLTATVSAVTANAGTAAISYASDAPAVATVNATSGLVTAVSEGTAKITAKITVGGQNYTAECTVTVTPSSTYFSDSELVLRVAASGSLTLTKPADKSVTYTSSKPSVATVNATTGAVTAVAVGDAVITATRTDNAAIKATYTVSVTNANRGKLDFIKGMDMSSVIALEQSGVVFRDADGNVADVFKVIAQNGVNMVRVRVWNDPYDADGNGYGGGNCDIDKAVAIGKRVTKYGMDLLVDFHYSDFWADPLKQSVPKAWVGKSVDEKAAAITEYTTASLNKLKAAGVDVGMVQVGNESNAFLCGEKNNWANISKLMKAGSAAVRAVYPDALVALHFTNPESSGKLKGYADQLNAYGVDYDVFGTSYYPCYHGSIANLKSVLSTVHNTYGKYVMVMETQYPYCEGDLDGGSNTLTSESKRKTDEDEPYSIVGQRNMVKKIFDAIAELDGGLGVCYWEGAWITVGGSTWTQAKYDKWMQYGSGWASKYAAGYDHQVTLNGGELNGAGSQVDNQAFFDSQGKPIASIDVFLNNYVVSGVNLLADHGFEDNAADTVLATTPTAGEWFASASSGTPTTFAVRTGSAKSGDNAFETWCSDAYTFTLGQTVTNVGAGTYKFIVYVRGNDTSASVKPYISVNGGAATYGTTVTTVNNTYTQCTVQANVPTDGATLQVGIEVTAGAGAWTATDDASLKKTA